MRLLLDTCTLIWLCASPEKMSTPARACIDDPDVDITVSHVSLWEMALKSFGGKMRFPKPLRRWIAEQKQIWKFSWLAITADHILTTGELAEHHKDPFDRLLAAQALRENIPLLTPDPYLARYSIECIW